MERLKVSGRWNILHKRNGNVLKDLVIHNAVVTEGLNYILGACFKGLTPSTTWYAGMIDNAGYSATPATDTLTSHPGWDEFSTYDQSTRIEWTAGSVASGVLTNSAAMTFTFAGSGTVKGLFMCDLATKDVGSGGILLSTGLFTDALPVVDGDDLDVTYTLTATSA